MAIRKVTFDGTTIVGVGGEPVPPHPFTVVDMDDQDPAVQAYLNPPPNVLTARQFWQQLAIQGLIDEEEAVDAMNGDLPNDIKHYINNVVPAPQRFEARMLFASKEFLFRNRTTNDIKTKYSLTDAAMRTFFFAAALL